MERRKISRRHLHFVDDAELGHFTLLFCRDGKEIYKGLMSKTIALHVRYNSWCISLPSSAKQQRENDHVLPILEKANRQWLIFSVFFWN